MDNYQDLHERLSKVGENVETDGDSTEVVPSKRKQKLSPSGLYTVSCLQCKKHETSLTRDEAQAFLNKHHH